jgi:hypothetical protein
MNFDLIDPLYNIKRTEVEKTLPGSSEPIKVTTNVVVETALPLGITQDADEAKEKNYLLLPKTAHINIRAYDLTISGALEFPARDVAIFTSILRIAANATPPVIAVDGMAPPENLEQLRPAPRQRPQQLDEGTPGDPGYNDTVAGPGGGRTCKDGGPGWSGPDHPVEMNGRDGKNGADWAGVYASDGSVEKRGDAGSIFICCERMVVPLGQILTLSANGGPAEPGQPGQDGAKGGTGGAGFDGVVRAPGVSYSGPTGGGAGGKGGDGGKGGKGGKGGNITVHCSAAPPPVSCSVSGGASRRARAAGAASEAMAAGAATASVSGRCSAIMTLTSTKLPKGPPARRRWTARRAMHILAIPALRRPPPATSPRWPWPASPASRSGRWCSKRRAAITSSRGCRTTGCRC